MTVEAPEEQVIAAVQATLAEKLGMPTSSITVSVTQLRRLQSMSSPPRKLAGIWQVDYVVVVPESMASEIESEAADTATDNTFVSLLQSNLASETGHSPDAFTMTFDEGGAAGGASSGASEDDDDDNAVIIAIVGGAVVVLGVLAIWFVSRRPAANNEMEKPFQRKNGPSVEAVQKKHTNKYTHAPGHLDTDRAGLIRTRPS